MKAHNIEQGSPEWHAIRLGRMTASKAQAIGNVGKGLESYIYEMLAEKYSSGENEQYTNKHIERGNELEEVARSIYEMENNVTVEQVGFIEHGDYAGCSPDGLVGEDGGLEIKCHEDKKHFRMLVNGEKEIDSAYVWQVQMNLKITGRKWWDLVFYCPNYTRSMIVFRITPNLESFAALEQGLEVGEKMIKELEAKFNQT
ncbi:YqaJ viral recombinase family protein [Candidatus Woesebacteria bacterium]|nr:YqaJ viral recombinase family protein [Candidatus Woesebacteria bacterium]